MERPIIDSQVTFLYTDDLEKSAQFYGETLGLKLWHDQGTCKIYEVSSTSLVGICLASAGSVQRTDTQGNVIFTIVTDDVDGWYEYLSAKGVKFGKEPSYNEQYKIYHCFLHDPNGYLLEIQRFMHDSA